LKLDIITPALPPQLNGIGDYTAQLAAALVAADRPPPSCAVRLLTGRSRPCAPVPGASIETAFTADRPGSVRSILQLVLASRPDWLLLQYNPFSYGRWGMNLYLPRVIAEIRRLSGETRFALMVHEPFVPVINWRWAIVTTWQRWQLWQLGRIAEVVFVSIDPWARRFRRWFPAGSVQHLPVGSNIPRVATSRAVVRARLGVPDETFVLGVFGTNHPSRMLHRVRSSAEAVRREGRGVLVLYMGPHGTVVREVMGDIPCLAEGPLTPGEVSRRFSAVDCYLAPFADGVSTRRTSLMTGLQHGVAVVGTRGPATDDLLRQADGEALLLAEVDSADAFHTHVVRAADDPGLRARLGQEAELLYTREFAWEQIASRLLAALQPGTHLVEQHSRRVA
jgi:glycosyltransferase involved in cell wall biosynthesis